MNRYLAAFILLLVSGLAYGHHSTLGFFDPEDTVELEGTLTSLSWRNPHIHSDIEEWNTENALNMNNMFSHAYFFHQNISHWNVQKVSSLDDVFEVTPQLNDCVKRHIHDSWTTQLDSTVVQFPYPHWSNYDPDHDCNEFTCEPNYIPDCRNEYVDIPERSARTSLALSLTHKTHTHTHTHIYIYTHTCLSRFIRLTQHTHTHTQVLCPGIVFK